MLYTTEKIEGRRLVLIDIENVVGGGVETTAQLRVAQSAITAAIGSTDGDLVVISCGRFSVNVVGFEWAGPRRLVFRPGADGADLEILDILRSERIAERFSQVVLVSGDGIFANEVSRLAGSAVDVTVATRPEKCSRVLRMAGTSTVYLTYPSSHLQEAA